MPVAPQEYEISVEAFLDDQNFLRISTEVPDPEEAPPIDIACVVDISDSMSQTAAGVNDGKTEYIEAGFSLLDLVKHALKTVVQVLRPCDRLMLIIFNEASQVILDFTEMTDFAQKQALGIIENLKTQGGTNMYKAMELAV